MDWEKIIGSFFYNILSGEFEPIYYDGDIKKITDFKYKKILKFQS